MAVFLVPRGRFMKVLGIDNIFLPVGDLAQAVRFYENALGLPVAKRFDGMGMVLFRIGDENAGLGVAVTDQPRVGGQKVWLEVPDARAAAEELAAIGVATLAPPSPIPTGWAFEIRDPWGNVLGFTDYVTRTELGRN
jgi:predicted enzyme related to lactoylglutathione lyase